MQTRIVCHANFSSAHGFTLSAVSQCSAIRRDAFASLSHHLSPACPPPPMDRSPPPRPRSLSALLLFKHSLNFDLVRSLHAYRFEDGEEAEEEREFLFSEEGSYVEMAAPPFLRLQSLCVSEVSAGRVIAPWVCFFAFSPPYHLPRLHTIPPILMISSNPKLESIPALASDLQIIIQWAGRLENGEPSHVPSEETPEANKDDQSKRPVFMFDLNCPPCAVATPEICDNQENDTEPPGHMTKKKRAASEDVAKIALEDLVKQFDFPMQEASRNLNIGLTVLKRKCREFGIPRWPHRKIKSLDSLIRDLQEEAGRQQLENKAAAMAVLKRQRMLESERKCIEQRPITEIEDETKRFRQDVFKRRHRARAQKNRG